VVKHGLLLVAGIFTALLAAPVPQAIAADSDCTGAVALAGCPNTSASVADNAVTVFGQESTPGSAGASPFSPPPPPLWRNHQLAIQCAIDPQPSCQAPPGTPTITINDIATFRPTPGRQQMEPDGWTIAGLDTNFYAITDPHVVNGTLLGRPADVRFTPISYRWTYGDGSAAAKSTKGGTWAALGIPEFDPTPTSHVYEQLGDYTITLSITFAAEYRFAGGAWRPVVGTITLPANNLYLRAGTAQTVLVEHDCNQNPGGPGC